MPGHHTLDYIEFPGGPDLEAVKAFYATVFGWDFTDYGPDYTAFARGEAGIDGGFASATGTMPPGILPVIYSSDLETTIEAVVAAGGRIMQDIFDFPGGRRFHFQDPAGNELAVWSDPAGRG